MLSDSDLILRLADPKFYLENLCKIKVKKGGLEPFILNNAQKDFFNTLKKSSRVICLKSRQIGFSTAITGYLYHKAIMIPGINVALIGYNSDLTRELLDKVKTFYRTTPESLRPLIQYNSKFEITFPKKESKIFILPSSENVGRGWTLTAALATELAFWDKADEKMTALEASIPATGQLIIESCVAGDTIVVTDKGLIEMSDVVDWANKPLGSFKAEEIILDGRYGKAKTDTYYNSGVQKGFEITTKSGRSIRTSSIHPLLLLRDGKLQMVKASEQRVGDYIASKIGQELWGTDRSTVGFLSPEYGFNKKNIVRFSPEEINEDLAYLMGLLLGDGFIYKDKYAVITNTDPEIQDFLLNNRLGLKFKKDKDGTDWHFRCSNESFVSFLRHIGFEEGKRAPQKEIPKCVLGWDRSLVVAFLQGLFDTDGTADRKRSRVAFTSTSKEIMRRLIPLLLNFGIVPRLYKRIVEPTKLVEARSLVHILEINSYFSDIFHQKIGFRILRKRSLKEIPSLDPEECRSMALPLGGDFLRSVKKILKFDINGISNKSLYSKNGAVSVKTLKKILESSADKYSDTFENLKEIANCGFFFDKITQIVPFEGEVFDFTVSDGHSFIANGFVSSNTPNGIGNIFHRIWMNDSNDYVKKQYGWWWYYTEEEIEVIRRRMDPQKFAQEYELIFLTAGRAVFSAESIERQKASILEVGDIIEGYGPVTKQEDGLTVFKKPADGGFYVFGVDTAEGVSGGDYSAVVVWDRKTGEEVASFRDYIAPDKLAVLLNKWGRHYKNALMTVEVNNHGLSVLVILKNLLYPNIYFRPTNFDSFTSTTGDRIGWKTTKVTRDILIDDFVEAIREGSLTIHSKFLLDEMTTFIYDRGNKPIAAEGYHDDGIFAAAVGLQGFKVMYDKPLTQLDYQAFLPKSFSY